ncbi:MAG TPA: flagellar motor protein MotD [Steroidobacteraceae bacterium]|jgi:chemotaxis protein MotB|nr:flagellar motor protein MotD [Steroidobacteraceae bacterium]
MARRRRHEEHDNHEAWAIPYGDLVTLLLAFFVVMYSMSSVNDGKYRVLSNSLTEAFHGTPRTPQPLDSAAPPVQPIAAMLPQAEVNRRIIAGLAAPQLLMPIPLAGAGAPAGPAPAPVHAARGARAAADITAAPDRQLNRVAADITGAMRALIASGQVHVRRYPGWVAVDISTDILFGSGQARLSRPAIGALQRLAAVLEPWPNAVRVEGHTDNRPIDTAAFPSNWELSAARAASVVHLFMDRGIAPDRLAVLGFGQYRPVAPNTTAAGRNANRRVEVVILGSDTAPEAGL